jgi:hypothetical protein
MNAPCLQSKDVNWIEVRPNFHSRNLSFCLGLHNCRPFCCTFFQYNLQSASPSNALPWFRPFRLLSYLGGYGQKEFYKIPKVYKNLIQVPFAGVQNLNQFSPLKSVQNLI